MSLRFSFTSCVRSECFLASALSGALAQMPNPYGLSISLDTAKKAVLPALAEAAKNNWSIA